MATSDVVAETFQHLSIDTPSPAERAYSDKDMQGSDALEGGFRLKAYGAPVALDEALPNEGRRGGALLSGQTARPAQIDLLLPEHDGDCGDGSADEGDHDEDIVVKPLQSLPRPAEDNGYGSYARRDANGRDSSDEGDANDRLQLSQLIEVEEEGEDDAEDRQPLQQHVHHHQQQWQPIMSAQKQPVILPQAVIEDATEGEDDEAASPQEGSDSDAPPVPAARQLAAADEDEAEEEQAPPPQTESDLEPEEEAAAVKPTPAPASVGAAEDDDEESDDQQPDSPPPAKPSVYKPPPRAMANAMGAIKGSVASHGAHINPDAEIIRSSEPLEEVRSSTVKVSEMSKQLKEHFENGMPFGGKPRSPTVERRSSNGGAVETPRSALRTSGAFMKEHDLVNTANVALVLQAGEFRLKPGVDVVPYLQLKELRLEDGLDVSRKEEYLSEEEFEEVFGMDKEDFRAMPPWKRINAKKAKGLF